MLSKLRDPDKKFLLWRWIPAMLLLQAACLAMAWSRYPRYSMFDHDISFLGHPRLNPAGWWWWSLAMGLSGVMLWPVVNWMSHRMRELTSHQTAWRRALVMIGSMAARGSCFGLIGLALVPQYPAFDMAHKIAGAVAFCGMYFTMMFFWGTALWGTSLGPAKAMLFTLVAFCGPVGYLATQGYRWFAYGELGRRIVVKDQSMLLRFSLWEWLLFFCGSTATIVLVLILPSRQASVAVALSLPDPATPLGRPVTASTLD